MDIQDVLGSAQDLSANINEQNGSAILSTGDAENMQEDEVNKSEFISGSETNTAVQACSARCSSALELTNCQGPIEEPPQSNTNFSPNSSTSETKSENEEELSGVENPSSEPGRVVGSYSSLIHRSSTPSGAFADDSSEGGEIPEGFEWINKLPKHMADETKRILKHGMTDEERDAIYDKYPIPDHLRKLLLPPKVNPEVWELMPPEAKYHDLSMCHIHKGLAHTVVALGEAVNLVKEKIEANNLNSDLSSLLLLSLNSSERYANLGSTVTEGRKDMIMTFLSSEAREEAKFAVPDDYLFGEDFQNGRTSRMMKKVKGKIRTKRFRARR